MFGKIKKIKNIFPITVANAVYIDGEKKTLYDAMKDGKLGKIGASKTIKPYIYADYDVLSVPSGRAYHDCTVIDGEIVSFDKVEDGGSIIYINPETGANVGRASHNFVESNNAKLQMKSVDYKYNKLLVGNGRAGYDVNFSRLYVYYEATSWKNKGETLTFSNCGNYTEIDVTSLGGKSYGYWGNGEDIIFVSCNLFNDIYRIQLAKGTTQFDNGTYTEVTDEYYNGTFKILNHWRQEGNLGQYASHGGQYYKDTLYLANNKGTPSEVFKCIFKDDGVLEFQPLVFDARKSNADTQIYTDIDGLCIYKGKMYMQPLSNGKVFMVHEL